MLVKLLNKKIGIFAVQIKSVFIQTTEQAVSQWWFKQLYEAKIYYREFSYVIYKKSFRANIHFNPTYKNICH